MTNFHNDEKAEIMMNIAQKNADMLNAIHNAGNSYTVRKYAGAWVPVIVVGGVRKSFAHCSTPCGAMESAIYQCAKASGWTE